MVAAATVIYKYTSSHLCKECDDSDVAVTVDFSTEVDLNFTWRSVDAPNFSCASVTQTTYYMQQYEMKYDNKIGHSYIRIRQSTRRTKVSRRKPALQVNYRTAAHASTKERALPTDLPVYAPETVWHYVENAREKKLETTEKKFEDGNKHALFT